jgi:Rieske Fe-S protein
LHGAADVNRRNLFQASARAQALSNAIRVDFSSLRPGEIKAYLYRGATTLVLRRTLEMLAKLATTDELVLDHGTDPDADGKEMVGDWWPGGFICPCHQPRFDHAGPTTWVIGEPTTPT